MQCSEMKNSKEIRKRENYLSASLVFHVTQVKSSISYPTENQDPPLDGIQSSPTSHLKKFRAQHLKKV
jgi:hypothetical protein